jgi:hypothetical protein
MHQVLKPSGFLSAGRNHAFPHQKNAPIILHQCRYVLAITSNVGIKLLLPKFVTCLGECRKSAVRMSMPKTSMHEYGNSMPAKHDVGTSRQIASMESKSQSRSVQQLSHDGFGARVLSTYPRHHPTSCRPVYYIH